jgi:pyruvate formate lyase activating enzyme
MTLTSTNPISKGFIFDIQGLSVHDGPGCRTLIFLNGCTLSCSWCSNPEGISIKPVPMYFASKCILCGKCVVNCSQNAISIENEKLEIAREYCALCDNKTCINECYTEALKLCGYEITVAKLLDIIKRDRQFWGSEGGITLTGGEPLLQVAFATEILAACHKAYIHTAIETCGNVPWNHFKEVIPFLDWIFYDLKHLNNDEHKKQTGSNNTLILDNAKKLSAEFNGRLIFRLPLIPGFNDTADNINSTIAFLKDSGRNEINILPLHHLGREKYNTLNGDYTAAKFPVPTIKQLSDIQQIFKESGIECYIGSNTPF